MKRIMTVDLEPNVDFSSCKSMGSVMPKLLNYFDEQKITATFFTVANLLPKYESEIKDISKKHEIASHSQTHQVLNPANAESEIDQSKKMFLEYGHDCKGFRAPQFIITKDHFSLLKKAGYSYDASLARYFPKRYNNPGLPKKPFFREDIYEFPMPSFFMFNSGLSYLKLFHPVSKSFSKPYLFYLHPWEFLERKELPPATSMVKRLLYRNTGRKAVNIFKNYVERADGKWVGCREWMEGAK